MATSPIPSAARGISIAFAVECAYLLVPWQAIAHGGFRFELNENLVTWAGAPLAYLAARSAWNVQKLKTAIVAFGSWWWLIEAVRFSYGHTEPDSVLLLVGWLPLLNVLLVMGLALTTRTESVADSGRWQKPAAPSIPRSPRSAPAFAAAPSSASPAQSLETQASSRARSATR
jgi:hypothetical protein